jgi:hypothetical protein
MNYKIENNYIERYLDCIYFAFITMVTVGYGDVTPKNKYEKIYTIIITLIRFIFFFFFFAKKLKLFFFFFVVQEFLDIQ